MHAIQNGQSRAEGSIGPKGWLPPRFRNREPAMAGSLLRLRQADRLPGPLPGVRQGIGRCDGSFLLEAETSIVSRITEHIDVADAGALLFLQARPDQCAADTLSLKPRRDGEGAQECNIPTTFGDAASGEDNMSYQQ